MVNGILDLGRIDLRQATVALVPTATMNDYMDPQGGAESSGRYVVVEDQFLAEHPL